MSVHIHTLKRERQRDREREADCLSGNLSLIHLTITKRYNKMNDQTHQEWGWGWVEAGRGVGRGGWRAREGLVPELSPTQLARQMSRYSQPCVISSSKLPIKKKNNRRTSGITPIRNVLGCIIRPDPEQQVVRSWAFLVLLAVRG